MSDGEESAKYEPLISDNEEVTDLAETETGTIGPDSTRGERNKGEQSVTSCIFNFVNATLGSGVLTIPYDISVAGYALGAVFVLAFAMLSILSYFILMRAANNAGVFEYENVCDALYHKSVGIIATMASVLFSCGCVISYVIVIKDNFFFFNEEEVLYKDLLLAGIMLGIILPLCFLPNLENLKFNSYLIFVVIVYVAIVCVYVFAKEAGANTLPTDTAAVVRSASMIQAFPLTTQAFNSQYNFLNLYRELANRKKNGANVVIGNILTILAIYAVIGFFGYFACGSGSIEADILVSLKKEGGVLVYIANVGMIILMICHYPVPVYSLRKVIEMYAFKTENYQNKKVSYAISAAIVLSATIIGMFLRSIDNVLDFTGSLAGGTLGMIIPGILGYKLGRNNMHKSWVVSGMFLCIVGAIITVLGFGMACYKWIALPLIR